MESQFTLQHENRLTAAVEEFNAAMLAAHDAGLTINAALFMRSRNNCSIAQISFALHERQAPRCGEKLR